MCMNKTKHVCVSVCACEQNNILIIIAARENYYKIINIFKIFVVNVENILTILN